MKKNTFLPYQPLFGTSFRILFILFSLYFYGLSTQPVLAAENTVTITEEEGVTTANYPVQIGRPFIQGEILNAPQALIDEVPVPTQADVKVRWPDGSVKHAILTFHIPQLVANSSVIVTFRNQPENNNDFLTQQEMLDFPNFDAQMQLDNGSTTLTASARAMLANGHFDYWLQGPIVTSIILADHSVDRSYDFSFDSHRSIRPIFHATFWPATGQVRVRFIGEISNTEFIQDQDYSLTLLLGENTPNQVYSQGEFTHYARSRWMKEFWMGGSPPTISMNHNLPYLIKTTLIPNYDTSIEISESAIAESYNNWTGSAHDNLFDPGNWQTSMPTGGGRPDIGPYPEWTVKWLYTGDHRMHEKAFGNSDLAAAWPMHYREGATDKLSCTLAGEESMGRILSVRCRPTLFAEEILSNDGLMEPEDRIEQVGPVLPPPGRPGPSNPWVPDNAHQPDPYSPQYLLSGDPWYLEQMMFWVSWGAISGPGCGGDGGPHFCRGPRGSGGITAQIRGQAWALRTRVNAASMTPDGTAEKRYFEAMIDEAIAIWEGERNIRGTAFEGNRFWTWGRRIGSQGFLRGEVPPLNHWNSGFGTCCQEPMDPGVVQGMGTPWETNFQMFALSRGRELGYPTDALVEFLGKHIIDQLTHPDYDPYLIASFRYPVIALNGPGAEDDDYFRTWVGMRSGFLPNYDPRGNFENNREQPDHGFALIAIPAAAAVAHLEGGAEAWRFMDENALQASEALRTEDPKWAIGPRDLDPIVVVKTIDPDVTTPGILVSVTVQATNTGEEDATNLTIRDQLANNHQMVAGSISHGGFIDSQNIIHWPIALLASGESIDLSYRALTLPPPNRAPQAVIAPPQITDLEVVFDGSLSSDPDGDSLTYSWDFGDSSDPSSEVSPTHNYNAAGSYTVALAVSDGEFTNTTTRIVTVQDGPGGNIIAVGPGRIFTVPSQAAAVAQDGDIIEIDAGLYTGDVAVWNQDDLTLRGVGGGRAHLDADGENAQGKGVWVITGDNITIENIEFSGATVPDENGAGIRAEGNGLIIRNSYFHNNENGILTSSSASGDILIEHSEFANNGFGDGRSHNVYVSSSNINEFTLRYSYSHHAVVGHNVKSRASTNFILYNRIMDEVTGRSSYDIDLPNGGTSYIIGNLLQKGPNAENTRAIFYGAEGITHPVSELYVVNNTFVHDRDDGIFIQVAGVTPAQIINNLFVGPATVLSGPGVLTSNLVTDTPGLVDRVNYDYRLTETSPAINFGTDPGSANGFDLTPTSHYEHPLGFSSRVAVDVLDVGAYEFGGSVNPGPTAVIDVLSVNELTVHFSGANSTDPDSLSLSYSWDFGDNTSSSNVEEVHDYPSAGTYTVSLTVDNGTSTHTVNTQVTVDDSTTPPDVILLEIEDMTLVNYEPFLVDGASNGQVASLAPSLEVTGTAETTFQGPEGTYDVILMHYDESDGEAFVTMALNGQMVGRVDFNQNLPGGRPGPDNAAEQMIASSLFIENGAAIQLVGNADYIVGETSEFANIDALRLVPTESLPNQEEPTPAEIFIEAESLGLVNYHPFIVDDVSNNEIATLSGMGEEEGVATLLFEGATGLYDVIIGVFDETDGQATLQLVVNDQVVGSIVLDEDISGTRPSLENFKERTIATALSIENGATLQISGFIDETEYANFDYIRIVPR